MPITIDIGGEGRHPGAINLNRSRYKTLGSERGEPIPRLIVAHAEALPLAAQSVNCVYVERTPLSRAALAEISRVMAPGGEVILTHVPLPDEDRHRLARKLLPGIVRQRRTQIGGQCVQETRIQFPAADTSASRF